MRVVFTTLVAGALAALVVAECPNACSGNGECSSKDACVCYDGFIGADCSQRACPSGFAFVDLPRGDLNHDGRLGGSTVTAGYSSVQWSLYKQHEYWPTTAGAFAYKSGNSDLDPIAIAGGGWAAAPDEAHFYAECSGKGMCNRATGLCQCFDGYTGAACQRTSCPNDCSGRGTCRTVKEVAAESRNKAFSYSAQGVNWYSGVQSPFDYRLWDASKQQTCVCDPGYTGIDCSLRLCPFGDDPLTAVNTMCGNSLCTNEVQGFTISGLAANDNKKYRIVFEHFSGELFTTDAFTVSVDTSDADAMAANAAAVKAVLEALPQNVTGIVSVSSAADLTSVPNVRFLVTFLTLSGNVPEFVVEAVTGAEPIAQPSQPVQVFSDVTAANAEEFTVTLFPLNSDGFRKEQFTSAAASVAAGSTESDVETVLVSAFRGVSKGPSVITYNFGTDGLPSVAVSGTTVTVVMPNKNLGSIGANILKDGNLLATGTLDTVDGNKEYKVCSDRGVCNYSTGLCKCFPGYFGQACQSQNALAM